MRIYSQANIPTEFALTAASNYTDIFNDIEVDVLFTGPDGESWKVPAFWAGDNVFRVRFAAPKPGVYTFKSICTNADDAGLHDKSGELEVTPYTGSNYLYKHGHINVAQNGRTFEHADGTPFFWLGDTWWMGLTQRFEWPDDVRTLALDRVEKGFNLIQIVVGPLPNFDAVTESWHPLQANEGGLPWEENWARINPKYYDMADLRIAYLVEKGLVPCIVGMWAFYLEFMGKENVKKHWRNLIARYGAYPVVWFGAGEVKLPTYSSHSDPAAWEKQREEQPKNWSEVVGYIHDTDPYSHPVTVHPGYMGDSRDALLDDSLVDYTILQTGHTAHGSLKQTVDLINAAVAKRPEKPVINGEPCYEGIIGSGWQEVQRFMFWTSITSGAAGHTYGAQGIWQMSTYEHPYSQDWGEGFWKDAMHYAGSEQVGIGKRFFERYPWHLFELRTESEFAGTGRVCQFSTGIPGAVAIFFYSAVWADPVYAGVQGINIDIEPNASYNAFFFNPCNGSQIEIGPVQPNADNKWMAPAKPSMADWVLVLEDKKALAAMQG